MMDQVEELLQQYEKAKGDKRRQLLTQLVWIPERREDPRVLPFCLRIAADPNEYDLARIEVFKYLELGSFTDPVSRRDIGQVIRKVLQLDSDDDMRTYAAGAAWRYLDVSGVEEAAKAVLLNPGEDETVRWNAFAIVGALGPSPEGIELAQSLHTDPIFTKAATDLLMKWHKLSFPTRDNDSR
jgi:hypothetical protein